MIHHPTLQPEARPNRLQQSALSIQHSVREHFGLKGDGDAGMEGAKWRFWLLATAIARQNQKPEIQGKTKTL
jgi:hypothetical protein